MYIATLSLLRTDEGYQLHDRYDNDLALTPIYIANTVLVHINITSNNDLNAYCPRAERKVVWDGRYI